MKKSRISLALFGAAMLFASGTFAGEPNKGTLNLTETVNVEGKALKPGSYRVEWTGTGSDVQVSIRQGKDTLATFPAHVTEQSNKNDSNAYGATEQTDGSRTLTAIYIGGKHTVLQLDANGATQQSSTQGSK